MKRFFPLFVLLAFLAVKLSAAQTAVLFSSQNLTGTVNNNTIHLTPDQTPQNPLWYGTNLVPTDPFDIYPVNGTNIQYLTPWGYNVQMDGWPRAIHIIVPASTNLLNAVSLINTNAYNPLNLYLNLLYPGSNMTFVTNADGSVTISSSGGSGANLTNGLWCILNTNGQGVVSYSVDAANLIAALGLVTNNAVGPNFYGLTLTSPTTFNTVTVSQITSAGGPALSLGGGSLSANYLFGNASGLTGLTAGQVAGAVTNRQITGLANQYDIRNFGAPVNGIALTNCRIQAGSSTFTAPSGEFNAGDVGKAITIYFANTNYQNFTAVISAVVNATNVTLNATAPLGKTNTLAIYGNDDATALTLAMNYCVTNGGGWSVIPPVWYSNNNAHGICCLATNISDLGAWGAHHSAQIYLQSGPKNGCGAVPLVGLLGSFPIAPGGSAASTYLNYFYGSTIASFAATPPTSTNWARVFDFSDFNSGFAVPTPSSTYTNYYGFYDAEIKNLNYIGCFNSGLRQLDLSGADDGRVLDSCIRAGLPAVALTNTFTYTNSEWGLMMPSLFNENLDLIQNVTVCNFANGIDLPFGGTASTLYVVNCYRAMTATNATGTSPCVLSWVNAANDRYIFGQAAEAGTVLVVNGLFVQPTLTAGQNAQIGGASILFDGSGGQLEGSGQFFAINTSQIASVGPNNLMPLSIGYQYTAPTYQSKLISQSSVTLRNQDTADSREAILEMAPGSGRQWDVYEDGNPSNPSGVPALGDAIGFMSYSLYQNFSSYAFAFNTNGVFMGASNIVTFGSFFGNAGPLTNYNAANLTGTAPNGLLTGGAYNGAGVTNLPFIVFPTNAGPSSITTNGSGYVTVVINTNYTLPGSVVTNNASPTFTNVTSLQGGLFTGNGAGLTNFVNQLFFTPSGIIRNKTTSLASSVAFWDLDFGGSSGTPAYVPSLLMAGTYVGATFICDQVTIPATTNITFSVSTRNGSGNTQVMQFVVQGPVTSPFITNWNTSYFQPTNSEAFVAMTNNGAAGVAIFGVFKLIGHN